jgi:hypothetical protein
MRTRICWRLPNLASARRTMDGLLLARIDDDHVHFVARDDIDLSGLHAAGVLQTSGLIRSLQAGLVGVIAIVSAAFGAWSSSMIGISTPSQRLARFEPALAQGQILLMTDVPRARVEEVEARLQARHPKAHREGVEPVIAAFR